MSISRLSCKDFYTTTNFYFSFLHEPCISISFPYLFPFPLFLTWSLTFPSFIVKTLKQTKLWQLELFSLKGNSFMQVVWSDILKVGKIYWKKLQYVFSGPLNRSFEEQSWTELTKECSKEKKIPPSLFSPRICRIPFYWFNSFDSNFGLLNKVTLWSI